MAIAAEWLRKAGFDAENGEIVLTWQPTRTFETRERWNFNKEIPEVTERVSLDHPWLNGEFSTGYGGVQAPSFIAQDSRRIYFIGCYDGSSWLETVEKDFECYVQGQDIPTVGGG